MHCITRCIHEAEEAAQKIYILPDKDVLVIAFLEQRLALLEMLDPTDTMWLELRCGLQIEISGRKAKVARLENAV